jgi:hypothetical protein
MGCRGSKNDVVELPPDLTEIKDTTDQRPKQIIKDIEKFYKIYLEKKELLKPLIAERSGLQALLDDERERLLGLLAKKDKIAQEREPLLVYTWERDADDIYKAFGKFSLDKGTLISIFMHRSKWQVEEIAKVFQNKYGRSLLDYVISEMTTVIGTLATGGNTGLAKLLTYRIMLQPERDAAFLRDFSDGIGLEDENLIEVVMTRTNAELRAAIDAYSREYNKDFVEIVKYKSTFKNYREFMLRVLDCERDESNDAFDDATATAFAKELYEAGAARSLGIDPEPFIRILPNINQRQFEAINRKYRDQQLIKDITSKLGGAFEMAVIARCSDKYEFLAKKVEKALKGFSVDKETLCRIFGSLKRQECIRLRDAYDRLRVNSQAKTLEQALKAALTNGNFQKALIDCITQAPELNPIGSDLETIDFENEAYNEGERMKKMADMAYRSEKIIAKGEELLRKKHKLRLAAEQQQNADAAHSEDAAAIGTSNIAIFFDEIDDEIPNFTWDAVRGRFADATKLSKELRDCQQATKDLLLLKERIADEILGLKDIYLNIVKSCGEAEVWTRIYTQQLRHLKEFVDKRDAEAATGGTSKKKK